MARLCHVTSVPRLCETKATFLMPGSLQHGKMDVQMKKLHGLTVKLPCLFSPPLSVPTSTGLGQSFSVHLAAIHSDAESAAYVDKSENDAKGRYEEKNEGFRRHIDDNGDIESDELMFEVIQACSDIYPMARTYRNDLCTLEVYGCASRSQVLAAMASDQSFTATANLLMGRRLTVLQTVIPGISGVHSTVSTKLFAPSSLVFESAKKFSMPNGIPPREFMHRLFEAVQLQKPAKYNVHFHIPGTVRDMSALEKEEMVQHSSSLDASDTEFLDFLGKAISLYAVACIKENAGGRTYLALFEKVWQKSRWTPSSKAPVKISMLSVTEIQRRAKILLELAHPSESVFVQKRAGHSWWPVPASLMVVMKRHLENATEHWIHEFMPLHKLHIDMSMLDARVKGGGTLAGEVKEILLTHAQLVDLAGALDLYYEDRFTIVDKKLQTGAMLDFHNVSRSKMEKFLEFAAMSSVIIGAGIFSWLVAAHMKRPSGMSAEKLSSTSVVVAGPVSASKQVQTRRRSEAILPINEQVSANEIEALCKVVVAEVAKAFAWHGQIQSSVGKGAWIGNHDDRLQDMAKISFAAPYIDTAENKNTVLETRIDGELHNQVDANLESADAGPKMEMSTAQGKRDALLYQVVLARDGHILGFQPLNQEAVSSWITVPFAQILHEGQKLGPGLWERPLKYKGPPVDAVVLELCILDDPVAPFMSARPFPM